ncbi:glycosyltransferase family 39 protein [Candidatus Daviesbacteria bacterium]|nr:glycosyltransferase family 39 protein [Candidatus Daviesbacteria bacterium]
MFISKALILITLLIAALLRFYNLPETFVFAGDEEHQTLLAESIVKDFHIIWIGVNAAHLGFYLGPYWTYFTAFWLWLSQGNMLITAYVASAIGVFTTLLVILIGSTLFGKRTGLIAGLLYATLPLMVFFDQRYWNPSLIPVLSILLLLSLAKLKQNPKMAILFAASFGMVFHTHLSLVPLILIAIFWIVWKKIKLPKKIIFLSAAVFLFMIFPLVIFDYFHKGTNITTPLRFQEISAAPVNNVNPVHHFQALFQTMGRIWYLQPYGINGDEIIAPCALSSRTDTIRELSKFSKRFNPPLFLSIAGSAILLLFLFNKLTWKNENNLLLALFISTMIISFLFFPGAAFEYYLLGSFPLFLFLAGILISYFKKFQYLIYAAVLILSVLGVFTVVTNNNEYSFAAKRSLIRQVKEIIGQEPFNIKQAGICHAHEAWRYFFVLNNIKPERSDSDEGLGWLYPDEITEKPARYTVVLSEERVPVNFDVSNARVITLKGFKAYIFLNKI